MFHELGWYRLKTGKITWDTIGKWLAKKFQMDKNPSEQYISCDKKRINTKFLALVRDRTARDILLSSAYTCPVL
jgi:hypothetical protein